jgi:DMSO/TMAO reductase YedYZ molybdopterin-dependent catalytic subunit
LFFNRRDLLKGVAVLPVAAAFGAAAAAEPSADPYRALYPAKRNETFVLDRDITPERITSRYNNFYEFGSSKEIADAAQSLKIRPWTVKIDGLVENPQELAIDDLIAAMPLEERLYRHRCVEGWAMAVPWTGFPLAALLSRAKPLGSAKYVRMETFLDRIMAPGQRQFWYPWPYVEGLTLAEAGNNLAFMVTGAYGKPLSKVLARRCVSRCRGNMDLNRSNRSPAYPWWRSGRTRFGNICRLRNMAFGPMSIRRCRIRAGVKRPKKCLARRSGVQPRFSTAMENSSPGFTRDWNKSRCTGEIYFPKN